MYTYSPQTFSIPTVPQLSAGTIIHRPLTNAEQD